MAGATLAHSGVGHLGEGAAPLGELVHELLDDAAERFPDRPALRDGGGVWTWAELDATSRRLASWLRGRGIGRGDRVLVRTRRQRDLVTLMFATFRVGAAFAPISVQMKPFHLAAVVADAEPALLVLDEHEMDLSGVAGAVALSDVLAAATGHDLDRSTTGVIGQDVALLLYTSGTTATPKAVVCPHRAVVFAAAAIARVLRYRPDDVIFCRLPLSFDYGLYQVFLGALAGAEVVLAADAPNAGLLASVRAAGATVVPLVPSVATMLTTLAARDPRPTGVRLFTNTGAALPAPAVRLLLDRFPGASIALMYGTTECKRITVREPEDGDLLRPDSVGPALPGTEVLVVDEAERPVPPMTVGEIVVRGGHVMAGYWRAPELTDRTFRRSPETGEVRLHTGDYGYLHPDGELVFVGRRDEIFKRNGVRASGVEIEAAAQDIPGVTGAALLPPAAGRDIVLFVATDLTPAQVLRELAIRLEAAKVPTDCRVLPAIPLTANGKPDRVALAGRLTR
ncbi:AMP-binding protein [Plantactinospora sp. S1510]|uniref:AMP-binding protein n=1 Tax=Plantactinospora alkalitolerans TaxID=2789879 RepID=A0ABS0H2X6_9ACTN|nr:AMP-binding protein [Plantactinospora alkalitolerans]MBF9132821.1 AMP-binding protein [Plantactinospora alkalitolerans]